MAGAVGAITSAFSSKAIRGLWKDEGSIERTTSSPIYGGTSSRRTSVSMSEMSASAMSTASGTMMVAQTVLMSTQFDIFIGFIIVANSVTVGVEQSLRLEGRNTSLVDICEHVFLAIYLVELSLRLWAFGFKVLRDHWVKFDATLVTVGVLTQWVMPLMDNMPSELGLLMVLRAGRLLRLARTLRLLIHFRELWMLVRGLLNSASTMIYTLLLLVVVLYIAASISMELITNHVLVKGEFPDPVFTALVAENFRNLPVTMLTLTQFVSLDNVVLIYRPLVELDPILAVYFMGLMLVVSVVLMNLVTAVVVNTALESAMQDKEAMRAHDAKKKKKMLGDLRKMFIRLDEDESGRVSREEMDSINDEEKMLLHGLMTTAEPAEIFDVLDIDGSGEVSIDEFCDGIGQVALSKSPIELKRIEKRVQFLQETVNQLCQGLKRHYGGALMDDSQREDGKLPLSQNHAYLSESTPFSQSTRMVSPDAEGGNGVFISSLNAVAEEVKEEKREAPAQPHKPESPLLDQPAECACAEADTSSPRWGSGRTRSPRSPAKPSVEPKFVQSLSGGLRLELPAVSARSKPEDLERGKPRAIDRPEWVEELGAVLHSEAKIIKSLLRSLVPPDSSGGGSALRGAAGMPGEPTTPRLPGTPPLGKTPSRADELFSDDAPSSGPPSSSQPKLPALWGPRLAKPEPVCPRSPGREQSSLNEPRPRAPSINRQLTL